MAIKKKTPVKTKAVVRRVPAKKSAAPKKTAVPKHVHPTASEKKLSKKKTILSTLLGVVLITGAGFGINEFTYYDHHVDTDDAHIDAEISPVIARVGGFVDSVRFIDNQKGRQGDNLVILDGRHYKVTLEQQEASPAA